MGWERVLFDSEWSQRSDIDATRERVQRLAHQEIHARGGMRRDIEALEADLGVLALFCRALSRLLLEKGVFSREEWLAALRAIDAHDGKADGRYTGPMDAP